MATTATNLGSTCGFTTRLSLRWVPEPPEETTDTIVISVGEWFIDLRMDKKSGAIDWAMAGTMVAENPNETPLKINFTRELDSLNEIGMVDSASFSALPNGDDLETGEMPHPELPGAPMTAFEEVWHNLPFREGPEGAKQGISWILESDDEDFRQSEEEGEVTLTKMFIGRVWGTYQAFQQVQVHSRRKDQDGNWVFKRTGAEVSARREEFSPGAGWVDKYVVGPEGASVPSMKTEFDGEGQGSWKVPGEKVVIDGKSFIVRAFEEIKQPCQ
ncbi:hypothetical protein N7532_010129 [Penicillium argentinense]|uniref:Protein HRI1 n=1 Tax=Penicillium argentinense TaxID=1131581 RepID=A0A9W9EP09_9EURO|nr:uncharacterized protein N7532_010129 [Penicillium argentinense]KAJ5085358.1 hypothetical protein N7532_010129 [Penicillium argentinense]